MTHIEASAWSARRTALWNAHDVSALAADHEAAGTVHSALAGIVRGVVAIEALYRRWFEAFPDLRFTVDHVFVEAGSVALFWEIQGTHHGPFLGIAPTHRRLRFAGAFLHEIVNGEIVYERRIIDFAGVMEEAFGDHTNDADE